MINEAHVIGKQDSHAVMTFGTSIMYGDLIHPRRERDVMLLKDSEQTEQEDKEIIIPIDEIRRNIPYFQLNEKSLTAKQIKDTSKIFKSMQFGLDEKERESLDELFHLQMKVWDEDDKSNLRANKKRLKKMVGEFHDGYPGRPRRLTTYKTRARASFLLPLAIVGALAAYKTLPRLLPQPTPVNIEAIVNQKYEQYAGAIAIAEEQRRPARALLVGGSVGANDNPPKDTDPEGHYRLAQWLTAGWMLASGLTNKEIEFMEYNPKKFL